MFIWIQNDKVFHSDELDPLQESDSAIIFNFSPEPITVQNMEFKILIKLVQKNHLKSLLSFMNNAFIPSIMVEDSWP